MGRDYPAKFLMPRQFQGELKADVSAGVFDLKRDYGNPSDLILLHRYQ